MDQKQQEEENKQQKEQNINQMQEETCHASACLNSEREKNRLKENVNSATGVKGTNTPRKMCQVRR